MPEGSAVRVHTEHAVLDIGDDIGALIIHFRREFVWLADRCKSERARMATHTHRCLRTSC